MAASFNKVILMGNLTRDPEMRVASTGNSICSFSLAVNRRVKQGDNWADEATFVDVDAFGKEAESIGKYMIKGRAILIEGRLQMDRWTDQEGKNRTKLKVVCEKFTFLGSGNRDDAGGSEAPSAPASSGSTKNYERSAPAPRHSAGGPPRIEDAEEDVPF